MPFLTAPKGTPMPDVATLAGMPLEVPGGALEGLAGAAKQGVGDIFGPISKAVQGLRNAAQGPIHWGEQAGETLSHLGEALRPAEPYAGVTRQPKAGGVLEQVLQRGGELQGAGQDVPPGTQRLLNHYAGLIR